MVEMTKAGKLTELVERVKAATGPDRELDAEFFQMWGEGYLVWDLGEPLYLKRPAGVVRQTRYDVPEYTASIDAAITLVARCLPGWRYDLHSPRRGAPWSAVLMEQKESRRIVAGEGESMPLAVCHALLLALDTSNAG